MNLCKQCYNERRPKQGEQPVSLSCEVMGGFWHLTVERAWAEAVLSDAEGKRQEGIQGNWQKASHFKQELELFKRSSDLSFTGLLVRRADHAGRSMELGKLQGKNSKKTASSVYGQV